MKVLTIKQPWASLIVDGYKKYEFRSWKTKYRGEILIHAGCGVDKEWLEKVKDYDLNNGITLCKECHKEVHKNEG